MLPCQPHNTRSIPLSWTKEECEKDACLEHQMRKRPAWLRTLREHPICACHPRLWHHFPPIRKWKGASSKKFKQMQPRSLTPLLRPLMMSQLHERRLCWPSTMENQLTSSWTRFVTSSYVRRLHQVTLCPTTKLATDLSSNEVPQAAFVLARPRMEKCRWTPSLWVGWQECEGEFLPPQTDQAPAPEKRLQIIRCNCDSDCS